MSRLAIVLDNPILTKHLRSRLRPSQAIPWFVAVLLACVCIVGSSQILASPGTGGRWGMAFLLGLDIVILVIAGGQQISVSLGGARSSGILDYHRLTPLPATWLTLGFFLGAPIREYLLWGITLPFILACSVFEGSGVLGWLALVVPLLLATWALHAFMLLTSLTARRARAAQGGGLAGIVAILILASPFISTGLYYAIELLRWPMPAIPFYGLSVPWLPVVLVIEAWLLGFLLLAATRKMRSERAHALTKPQAVSCLASFAVLLVGVSWGFRGGDYVVVWVAYIVLIPALVLAVTITPNRREYLRGLDRAARSGRRRPGVWADAGTNRVALILLCAIVLLATTIAWEAVEGRRPDNTSAYSLAIATTVFVVAYFGLALQYFHLRLRSTGATLFQVFLALAWVLPLVLGALIGLAGASGSVSGDVARTVAAVSPIGGIALASGVADSISSPAWPRLAAVAPAITFAFVFNFLLVAVQRKIDLAFRTAERAHPSPEAPRTKLAPSAADA